MTSILDDHGDISPRQRTAERQIGVVRADPAVLRSWRRCGERGLARDSRPHLELRPEASHLESETAAHALSLVRPAMEDVYQFIEGSRTVIGFVDADVRLLDMIGDKALRDELASAGWAVSACVGEMCVGTNGPALAVEESFPAMVDGDAHFCTFLAPFCTAGAPVHDSLGALVGALFAVTPAGECHPHTLGMISAAATALTGELRMNLWLSSANELFSELNAILQTLPEGILLLQPDGTVSQMNARAGHLLGCTTARAVGQRLADLVEMPSVLQDALRQGRELQDEEATFVVRGNRVTCVCTLRSMAVPAPASLVGLGEVATRLGLASAGGVRVSPAALNGGYVLTLRSIDRVQRLVQRMGGAQARIRFSNIIGQSPSLLEATRLAHIAAESESTVLLHGETGTGKEIFAQSIHNGSARARGPFVAINCAAIPRELISSELFGYEGGAFTGADRMGRPGKFELANGGTLFLDEIGDMPPDLQTSLLRALETRSIVRVGGQHVTPVDVRVIAATHRDLVEEVRRNTFRSDLFFRLNVFPIEVPALRERPGDVALLLQYVLQRLSTRLSRPLGVDASALAALDAYSWPGNIRELENVVERVVYVADHSMIALGDLPDEIRAARRGHDYDSGIRAQHGAIGAAPDETANASAHGLPQYDLRHESESAEWQLIQRALRGSGGNLAKAAQQLGISRTTLWRKMRHATAR